MGVNHKGSFIFFHEILFPFPATHTDLPVKFLHCFWNWNTYGSSTVILRGPTKQVTYINAKPGSHWLT